VQPGEIVSGERVGQLQLGDDPVRAAAELYASLHRLDGEGWDLIVVEEPPATEAWEAIRDRLRRAAATE
jgi:L-threonylcarbamoyladenylate synthase